MRWFERGLFSVMGPAAIGDINAPVTYVADPADSLCPRCHEPWDDHTVERPSNLTVARCPSAPA